MSKLQSSVKILMVTALVASYSFTSLAQNADGPPPAVVEVAKASDEMMAPQVLMPGTVISKNDSRIAAEIAGKVTWVAPEGTHVKIGDALAHIDSRDIELAVARAKSQITRLKSRVKYLNTDLVRLNELSANNNIPLSRLQEAQSTLAMTAEDLTQAELALKQAEINLDRTVVKAPFPGRVVARLAQTGEYSVPGRQLVRLVDTNHLEISTQAPVGLAQLLADGQPVSLVFGGEQIQTPIRAMIPVGNSLSRTMEIRIKLPYDRSWVVGTAVEIGLPSAAPENVVAVPRDALVLRNEGTYVFRVKDDNTAERLLVRTGIASGSKVAVGGGIRRGDIVIIRGGERLRPGQEVRLKENNDLASS